MDAEVLAPIPPHVPPELVFDVDLNNNPDFRSDLHAKQVRLLEKYPDVFFTPRDGGHWIVMGHALCTAVMNDPEHFSTRQGQIPPVEPGLRLLPLSLDPPTHTPYRVALMRYLGPRGIAAMTEHIRATAVRLLDELVRQDRFEFVRPLGAALPVTVFMNMMGLPLERFDEFRALVTEFFSPVSEERRRELYMKMDYEMGAAIADRQRNPGEDLISKLLQEPIEGKPFDVDDLRSVCDLLFLAGLDTVANAAAFTFYYLAGRPDIQEQLAADPGLIPDFVEESLRMYGVVNPPRQVIKDVELGGAPMKAGEMVLTMCSMAGRDERAVPDANSFQVSRPSHPHMIFGGGPHVCAGQYLARVEMRILVEEWFKRVKAFRLAPGYEAEFRSWHVMALSRLELEITRR